MDDPKMTANPFAALLDGVPRLVFTNYGQPERFMKEDLVLAALAAAVVDDMAEAGEIAEQLLREADGFSVRASDTITALLARIAAQEAQIKGVIASRDNFKWAAEKAIAVAEKNTAALAAERAKTAKLVEAARALQADMLERARIGTDAIHGEEYRIVNAGRTAWADFCAAITEAGK